MENCKIKETKNKVIAKIPKEEKHTFEEVKQLLLNKLYDYLSEDKKSTFNICQIDIELAKVLLND